MSWRFALRPKWIVRHVLVVVLCGVMIALGLWQLERMGDKRAYRDLVQARQELPSTDVAEVVPADADEDAVDGVLYRSVEAVGTYAVDDTFVVENRTLNGASGAWVLTPLVLPDGAAAVVNRGFVGFDRNGGIVPPPAPVGRVHDYEAGLLQPFGNEGNHSGVVFDEEKAHGVTWVTPYSMPWRCGLSTPVRRHCRMLICGACCGQSPRLA